MTEVHHDTRINSAELAHHIGYAEYPHMEMAKAALRVGLEDDYQRYLSEAELSGQDAGAEYVKLISNDLASYALVSETLGSDNPVSIIENTSNERYPGVRITKSDMIAFAEEQNVAGTSSKIDGAGSTINPNAKKAAAAWSSLAYLAEDLKQVNGRRIKPLIAIEVSATESNSLRSVGDFYLDFSIDTLMSLIEEYDRLKELYPSMQTGEILGTGFGEAKIAFIRDFVEYKKAQLAEELESIK